MFPFFFAFLLLIIISTAFTDPVWQPVEDVINIAIKNSTFPGAVALVGSMEKGIIFHKSFGGYTYGLSPTYPGKMQLDTMFDLASLTKIFATTTAAMQLYEKGILKLDMPLASPQLLGPDFATIPVKQYITVAMCLTHSAGYPPDPTPEFWSKQANCPQLDVHTPETFECVDKSFNWALFNQTLLNPPNTKYVYSDLSMITLAWSIGHLVETHQLVSENDILSQCRPFLHQTGTKYHCYFEAYVRKHIYEPMKFKNTGFLPEKDVWPQCAPTENFTNINENGWNIFNRQVQGQVSDQNSYILGGIAGHAGLFSNSFELLAIIQDWMNAYYHNTYGNLQIGQKTIQKFSKPYNISQSGRGLGFDTNSDINFTGCRALPTDTFLHLGFTGTQFCISPSADLFTILLTNRVYPSGSNFKIEPVRNQFNAAVWKIWKEHFVK